MTVNGSELSEFDQMRVDALREFGSIGALHASNALASLIGMDVGVEVPECVICRVEELKEHFEDLEETVAAAFLEAHGTERGSILMIFPLNMAKELSDMVIGGKADPDRALDEGDREVLCEVGNICASAYLNAISQILGIVMLPSPPGVAVGMKGAILEYPSSLSAEVLEYLVIIGTEFQLNGSVYPGSILYFPDKSSQDSLMDYFGIQ